MKARAPLIGFAAAALVVAFGVWLATTNEPRRSSGGSCSEEHAPSAPPHGETPPLASEPATTNTREPERAAATPDANATTLALLEGTVRRASTREPLANLSVEVFARAEGLAWPETLATDANGRFRRAWRSTVELAFVRVRAGPSTGSETRYVRRAVTPATPVTLEFEIGDGAALSGRVVDEEGRAIAGAEVVAWCDSSFRPERTPDRTSMSDAQGAFRLEHLGPEFTLTARKAGFACARGLRGRLEDGSHVAERANDLVVTLAPADALRGLVVDEGDRPIEGAQLSIMADGESSDRDVTAVPGVQPFYPVHLDARSDANGRFELAPVPRRTWGVSAAKQGFRPAHVAVDVGKDARLVLERGLTLRGRVLAHDGTPARGALVRGGAIGFEDRRTQTDELGRFELTALAPEQPVYVMVHARGSALFRRNAIEVGTQDPAPIEIRLEEPAHIGGIVVDAAKRPLAGARVHLQGAAVVDVGTIFSQPSTVEFLLGRDTCTTDEAGRFRFDDLYAGEFEVTASRDAASRLFQRAQVRTSVEDLELVLDESKLERVVLKGRVIDALTRAPIQKSRLSPLRRQPNGAANGTQVPIDDPAGAFRIAGLQAGEYLVDVYADGYATWRSEARTLDEGEHVFDVEMFPARSLQASVRWKGAKPMNQTVNVSFETFGGRALSLEAGRSSWGSIALHETPTYISGLPATRVRAKIDAAPGVSADPIEVDLTNGEVAPIVFELDYAQPPEERLRSYHLLAVWVSDARDAGITLEEFGRLAAEGKAGFLEDALEISFLDAAGTERAHASLGALKDGKRTESFSRTGMSSKSEGTKNSALRCDLEARIRSARATANGYVERTLPIVPTDEEDPLILVVLVRK